MLWKVSASRYVLVSFVLVLMTSLRAFWYYSYFYRVINYLLDSKLSLFLLGNFAVSVMLCIGKGVQWMLLGNLRSREVEMLTFRTKETILETFLAMSIFRDEFGLVFLFLFCTLLFFKIFHWIAKDRVDFVEETPNQPWQQQLRLCCLLLFLGVSDVAFLVFSLYQIASNESSFFVLFAFEFGILLISELFACAKYLVVMIDLSYGGGQWEESRTIWLFWSEMISDILQLCAYISFFTYIHMMYSLPLHIVRDMYITIRRLQKHYTEYMRYKQIIAIMNQRFPEATTEELNRMDRTCIICRDDMQHAKKLSCGHMFHSRCLLSWLKRQLSCPTCRASVDLSMHSSEESTVDREQGNRQAENQIRRQIQNDDRNVRSFRVGLRFNVGGGLTNIQAMNEHIMNALHESATPMLLRPFPSQLPHVEDFIPSSMGLLEEDWRRISEQQGFNRTRRVSSDDLLEQMQRIQESIATPIHQA